MKKLLSIILILASVSLLVGCNEKKEVYKPYPHEKWYVYYPVYDENEVWQGNDLELVLSYVVNNNETVTFTVKNRFYGINFDSRKTLKITLDKDERFDFRVVEKEILGDD